MSRQQQEHLAGVFKRNKSRTVLIDARTARTVTYGELMDDSLRAAALLRELGVRRGDQVAFSMDNCYELAALYLGCMHLGAQILPINPLFHPSDFQTILSTNSAKLMFTSPLVSSRVSDVLAKLPHIRVNCFRAGAEVARKKNSERINFDCAAALQAQKAEGEPFAAADDDDAFLMMMSSGTTQEPKAIEITYAGLIGNARAFNNRLRIGPDNRFYNVLPMTYLGGAYNLMLLPIAAEGSFVLDVPFGVPNMYAFWETVLKHGINTLWFNSTMLSMLLSLEDEIDLAALPSQIKLGLVGMAPLPVDLKKKFEKRFGFTIYENYGLSETTFLTTNEPGRPYKDGSAGRVIEGVSVKIVDSALTELPPECEGQVLIRTPYFMKGYRRCAESDRKNVLADGSFLTGDVGMLDADGELFLTGRVKDLIIRGGINISPKAIEDVLHRLDAVEELAVVGVPHPVYGEEVAAVIKLRESHKDSLSTEDVLKFCEEHVANFQRPKLVYFIDKLPKGATGKIQKNVLRQIIREKIDPLSV